MMHMIKAISQEGATFDLANLIFKCHFV